MTTQRNPRATLTAGIYIDLENLGDIRADTKPAENVIKYTLENWSKNHPRISSIAVYGKTATVPWETAIHGTVDELMKEVWPFANEKPDVKVIDTSAYGSNPGKNTADIKLAMDACQDMLSGAVNFIAVLSNDSDFFSLYKKVEELKNLSGDGRFPSLSPSNGRDNNIPFSIINHEIGTAKVAKPIEDLVPSTYRIKLPKEAQYPLTDIADKEIAENKLDGMPQKNTAGSSTPTLIDKPATQSASKPSDNQIVDALVSGLKIGGFRYWRARGSIAKILPSLPIPEGADFDNRFLRPLIGKEMKKENPRILIPRDRLIRLYEIPPAAKGKEGPTLLELAEEIAQKVRLTSFTVDDVEKIIEDRWPNYAAIRDWPRPDHWFHFNLWPLLKLTERNVGTKKDDMPEDGKYSLDIIEIRELRQHFAQAKKGATK